LVFPCSLWSNATSSNMWHRMNNVAQIKQMSELSKSVEVHLGRQGRLVIPAALRRLLGFEEGDKLVAREEAGRLVLEKPEAIKQQLKARFAQVPTNRSLVNELIAERRQAAKKEASE